MYFPEEAYSSPFTTAYFPGDRKGKNPEKNRTIPSKGEASGVVVGSGVWIGKLTVVRGTSVGGVVGVTVLMAIAGLCDAVPV